MEKVVADYPNAGLNLYGLAAMRTLSGGVLAIQQTRYEAAATCAAGTPLEAGIGSSKVFGGDPNLNPAHRAGQGKARKARTAQCFTRGVPEARFDYRYGFHSATSRRVFGHMIGGSAMGSWSHDREGGVLIEPDYRRHRIEVNAVAERDRFNAELRIRRHAVNEKPHVEIVNCWKQVEIVNCWKQTVTAAERAGALWARRWIEGRLYSE